MTSYLRMNLTDGYPTAEDSRVKCLSKLDGKFGFSADRLSIASVFSPKIRDAVKLE